MKIHREGFTIITGTIALLGLINILLLLLLPGKAELLITSIVISLIIFLMILQFFRYPKREISRNDNYIICPADGKVVAIEKTVEGEYFKDQRIQVSIFMSPANVHVNRNPMDGEVVYNQYHKGKYLVAWHPKSSTDNERHSVVIKKDNTEVLVKQIAGALAKRIVNYLQVGQKVKQTEEMGFIKFGSRVDLLLPVGTKVNVELNQAVQGGVTVIATL